MKRLTILGIIFCAGLFFVPAAVLGDPAGPPGGLDVNVVSPNPLPVSGNVNATVTGDVNVVNEPGVTVLNDYNTPIPVAVQTGGPLVYRFVGVTENRTSGGPGQIGMNIKCQAEFGDGARMCTTEEFYKTGMAEYLIGPSWINASVADVKLIDLPSGDITWLIITTTGQAATSYPFCAGCDPMGNNTSWNCHHWENAYGPDMGTVITSSGRFATVSCSWDNFIICCAPSAPSP